MAVLSMYEAVRKGDDLMTNSKGRNTHEEFMSRETTHVSLEAKVIIPLSELKSMPAWQAVGVCEDPETLKKLLESGVDIEARDHNGRTLLIVAAEQNPNHEIVRLLLDAGADVAFRTKFGVTALGQAARCNPNPKVLNVLIDAGAEIESRSFQGQTPLMLAAYRITNAESMRLLIDAGARIEEKDLGADDDGAVLEQKLADLEEIAFRPQCASPANGGSAPCGNTKEGG